MEARAHEMALAYQEFWDKTDPMEPEFTDNLSKEEDERQALMREENARRLNAIKNLLENKDEPKPLFPTEPCPPDDGPELADGHTVLEPVWPDPSR